MKKDYEWEERVAKGLPPLYDEDIPSINDIEKEGEYKCFFSNGQLKIKGEYKEGRKHGSWQWYYQNGQSLKEIIYENDKLISEKRWSHTGEIIPEKPKSMYNLSHGFWNGKYFFDQVLGYRMTTQSPKVGFLFKKQLYEYSKNFQSNSKVERFISHMDDNFNFIESNYNEAVFITYHHSCIESDSKRSGSTTEYLAQMNKSLQFGIKNGQLFGSFRKWYFSKTGIGQIEIEGKHKNDTLDGLWRFWWPNGNLKKECRYEGGKKVGIQKEWFPNGILKSMGSYKDTKKLQVWRALKVEQLNKGLKFIVKQRVDLFQEEVVCVYDFDFDNVHHLKHGEWKEWSETGDLTTEEVWNFGKLVSKK